MLGSGNIWDIYANGQQVVHAMRRGGFCSIQAYPDELKLETKQGWNWASLAGFNLLNQIKQEQPTLQIAPGQTYYLEMGFGKDREALTPVAAEHGRTYLAPCHWVNRPRS